MTFLRRCAGLALVFLVVGAVGFGSAPTSPLPVVGVTAGPTWASQINAAIAELQTIVTPKLGNAQLDLGADADVKHGVRTVRMGVASAGAVIGAALATGSLPVEFRRAAGASDEVNWDISLADNERLTEVSLYGEVAVATAWTAGVWLFDPLTGVVVNIGGQVNSSTSAGRSKVTVALTQTMASPKHVRVRWLSGAANNIVRAVEYKFDKIATP